MVSLVGVITAVTSAKVGAVEVVVSVTGRMKRMFVIEAR